LLLFDIELSFLAVPHCSPVTVLSLPQLNISNGRTSSIFQILLIAKENWRDFPNISQLSLYVNLLKTMYGCLEIITVKVYHLNSCVTGRLYFGCLCTTVTEFPSAITRTFAVNSLTVVAISHILSALYLKSNECSGGTSGCNGGILLKIHNFHWSHTSTKDANMVVIGK